MLSMQSAGSFLDAWGFAIVGCSTLLLVFLQWHLRFALRRKHTALLAGVSSVASAKDAVQEVFGDTAYEEFCFIGRTALELGFFYTFGIPTIAFLLHKTGEFAPPKVVKRYNDTDLLLEAMGMREHGSPQRQAAVQRLNQLHGKYRISDADYLYTLSLFALDTVDATNAYGHRELSPGEAASIFLQWQGMGWDMGLSKHGLLQRHATSVSALRAWRTAYEVNTMKYHPTIHALSEQALTVFQHHPALRWSLPAMTTVAWLCGGGGSWAAARQTAFAAFATHILRPVVCITTSHRLAVAMGYARPTCTAQLHPAIRQRALQLGAHGPALPSDHPQVQAYAPITPSQARERLYGRGKPRGLSLHSVAHMPLPPWVSADAAVRGLQATDEATDAAIRALQQAAGGPLVPCMDGQQEAEPLESHTPSASSSATHSQEYALAPEHCDALGIPEPVHVPAGMRTLVAMALLFIAGVMRFMCFPRCFSARRLGPAPPASSVQAAASASEPMLHAYFGACPMPLQVGSIGPKGSPPLRVPAGHSGCPFAGVTQGPALAGAGCLRTKPGEK